MSEPTIPGPELPWGTVTHSALGVFADGEDPNLHPDLHLVKSLVVTFRASIRAAVWTGGTRPHTLVPEDVTGRYDDDGLLKLVNRDGSLGAEDVRLWATTGPDMEPTGWHWRVSWSNAALPGGKFELDPGGTVDLSTVVLGGTTPGTPLVFADLLQAAADLRAAIIEGGGPIGGGGGATLTPDPANPGLYLIGA